MYVTVFSKRFIDKLYKNTCYTLLHKGKRDVTKKSKEESQSLDSIVQ